MFRNQCLEKVRGSEIWHVKSDKCEYQSDGRSFHLCSVSGFCLTVAEIMAREQATVAPTALTPNWAWRALGCVSTLSLSILPRGGGGVTGSLRSDGWKVLWPSFSHSLTSLLSLPSQGSALLVMA